MSKQNNVHPDHYTQAGRERQGDGIVHAGERAELERTARERRKAAREPHIPNEEHASAPRQKHAEPDAPESVGPERLTDDEGMID